ncbi:SdiA-regulated/phytase-like domain-containing protein [Spartinivicinus ruber]|uniref:hypothetical protein n=1 Tax=Spartinivicinus ruber TaxID=2683272 RepID=UPI0013D60C1F|nr:hypothetical protein [Spartinivicinus ruber]
MVEANPNEIYVITDKQTAIKFTIEKYKEPLEKEITIKPASEAILLNFGTGFEFGGITYNRETTGFYLINSDNNESNDDILYKFNREFTKIDGSKITIANDASRTKNFQVYDTAGVLYANNHIYVISEAFKKVLKMNTDGVIQAVYALPCKSPKEPSEIAIYKGSIWLIGDNEDTPLAYQYSLSSH